MRVTWRMWVSSAWKWGAVLGEFINCREGALRGRRSLRDLYTGFAWSLTMVGMKIFHRDQRER